MADEPVKIEFPKELSEFMVGVGTSIKDLKESVQNLNTRIGELKPGEPKGEPKPKPSARSDLETLPRSEFLKIIIDEVKDALGGDLKELKEGLTSIDQGRRSDRIGTELDRLRRDEPDFKDFEPEMIEIAKATPGISPERAYKLARLENPDKAKEMDDKYKTSEQRKREEEDAQRLKDAEERKLNPFGGLTPTSGKVAKDEKPRSTTEAAEEAWDEVFGSGSVE